MVKIVTQKGFTLIELIVTLVIIMVLASVGIIKYIDLSERTKTEVCQANLAALESAQKMYYINNTLNNNGSYADDLNDLIPYLNNNILPSCPDGGIYQIDANNQIFCSRPAHQ